MDERKEAYTKVCRLSQLYQYMHDTKGDSGSYKASLAERVAWLRRRMEMSDEGRDALDS